MSKSSHTDGQMQVSPFVSLLKIAIGMMGAITPDSMNEGVVKAGGRLKFEITPRRRRDGFTLRSTLLSFPVWYQTLNEAVSYARFVCRDHGCDIRINDSKGNSIEEISIDESQNRQVNDLRLTRFTDGEIRRPASGRRNRNISTSYQYIALEAA